MINSIQLAAFEESGVRVQIAFECDNQGDEYLTATYTPTRAGFHLYGSSLPRMGIDGVGRPTLLEIFSANGLEPSGPLIASAAPLEDRVEGFDRPFAIYPDGPVTLRQAILVNSSDNAATAELAITYMTCSSQGVCLPPVENHRLAVTIPLSEKVAAPEALRQNEQHSQESTTNTLGYNPQGDPFAALERAKTHAQHSGRRILLEVGGDWCIWCHKLEHFFAANPDVAGFLDQHFVLLKVHYSKQIPNTEFLSQFPPGAGYPHIFVLDAQGSLLHSQNTGDLESGDHHDWDKVYAFLQAWAGG